MNRLLDVHFLLLHIHTVRDQLCTLNYTAAVHTSYNCLPGVDVVDKVRTNGDTFRVP